MADGKKASGMAIASLVLGIVSVCGGGIIFIPSVLAIIFAIVAFGKIKKDQMVTGKGMAVAGLVLGIVTVAGYVITWVVSGAAILGMIGLAAAAAK